jgi:hypothetical protein
MKVLFPEPVIPMTAMKTSKELGTNGFWKVFWYVASSPTGAAAEEGLHHAGAGRAFITFVYMLDPTREVISYCCDGSNCDKLRSTLVS